MSVSKLLLLFLFLFLSSFNLSKSKPYFVKWVINKECSLKVGGSTNINKFTCVIANYYKPDTLTFYEANGSEPLKISGLLKLDVQNFDCYNPMMTKDLRKTLKAKEYPNLIIRFINLNRYPDGNQTAAVKGLVNIELAGVTKSFDVDYKFTHSSNNFLTLVGTRNINFSDFGLTPPRKLGGMIQTNDKLSVEFNLNVKIIH